MRLIDVDALEKELSKRWDISDDQDFCNKEVWEALRNAQTVQADRPHGEWKKIQKYYEYIDHYGTTFECSICHNVTGYAFDFCPNCGSDMR